MRDRRPPETTRAERWAQSAAESAAAEKDPQLRMLKVLELMEQRQQVRWDRLYHHLTWLPFTWSAISAAFGLVGWFLYRVIVALVEKP
jgi:hypothetical protein